MCLKTECVKYELIFFRVDFVSSFWHTYSAHLGPFMTVIHERHLARAIDFCVLK